MEGCPLLGVVADNRNDELFCERAKNNRERCMKERAGNCELRRNHWQGWMVGSRFDVGPWCGGNIHSATVGAIPCDRRDGCIAQSLELPSGRKES